MFATENSIMGITPYIFTKKLFLLVAVLSFAVLAVQAQNSTHQSINDVLKQTVGKEIKLSYHIPEEEAVPAIFVSGNVAYKLKTVVHQVNESKQDIFAENLDNILYPDNGEIGIDISGHVGLSGKTTYVDEKSKTQLLTY